ncbi:hypothetical protein KY346_06400 [Candidatus Woesearchaeota archaeon]|nr:hypothetical protein [Candidatus Woesearchaeota archaeon]
MNQARRLNKMQKYIKICPKCGSIDIKEELDNPAKVRFGAPLDFICQACGFKAKIFPEVKEEEIEDFRKKLKK